jgi:integrase
LSTTLFPLGAPDRRRSILRKDVISLIDGIVDRGAPIQANRTLAVLRRLFNWAVERELLDANPVSGMSMPAVEASRDRVLSDDEIRLFWSACEEIGWPFGPVFKLLLVTAQRRDEVGTAEWHEIDLATRLWTIPREKSKNDLAHEVHLSNLAIDLIKALPRIAVPCDGDGKHLTEHEYVFTTNGVRPASGYSRAKRRLDADMLKRLAKQKRDLDHEAGRAVIAEWTLHDLRRTAASGSNLTLGTHV